MNVYANLVGDKVSDKGLHRLDTDLLRKRNSLGILTWRYLKHLWKQPIALFGATKFVFRKTAELLPAKHQPESRKDDDNYPNILGDWISEEQVQRLSQHAQSNDVMLNSVLLSEFYGAIIDWRKQYADHQFGAVSYTHLRSLALRSSFDRRRGRVNPMHQRLDECLCEPGW